MPQLNRDQTLPLTGLRAHQRAAGSGGGDRAIPVSAYRLLLTPSFGFADVASIAPYLAGLGVTHVALSPILQAAPGSADGYDVVDHSRISAELGGEAAFRAMADRLHGHGLGVIVDIMPGHMPSGPVQFNRQLWSVLRDGTDSQYAHWFDIDWAAQGGRILLPILAAPVEECLDDLSVERSGGRAVRQSGDMPDEVTVRETVLRYFDHVLPVRPGTERLPLGQLLEAQWYRLAYWRAAATELNWRRLYDIAWLIAIHVEDPRIFAATHELLLTLMRDGLIDGLRIIEIDQLTDPGGYLQQLAVRTGKAWVVADKILTGAEQLPPWPCAGTTGYDSLGAVGGLFVEPAAGALLAGEYVRRTGGPTSFEYAVATAKRETISRAFTAEVSTLCRLLTQSAGPPLSEFSAEDLRAVLIELVTAFPVYRAYVVPGEPTPQESAVAVARAAASARHNLPDRLEPALRAVSWLVLGLDGNPRRAKARNELIIRFQQTCTSVMVKSVEDTAFYRWSRLAALNEIGSEPDRFGVSPAQFHAFARRLARDWPMTLTTLSTFSTKQQEDVRARLAVLAELPEEWGQQVAHWHDHAAGLAKGQLPTPEAEYWWWQTLVGAWPIDRERMSLILQKMMREEGAATSWAEPDQAYEAQALAFFEASMSNSALTRHIAEFVARIVSYARMNTLGAKLIQLTMPGIPEIYQGCEVTGLWLFPPDNRRPVDFAWRSQMLAALDADPPGAAGERGIAPDASLDTEKLLVTSRTLRLRRDHPDWFAGSYTPLPALGPAARHAFAFIRGGRVVTVATRLPVGLQRSGGWADTVLPLPEQRFRDALTGITHIGPRLPLSVVLEQLPVALLVRDDPQQANLPV